MSTLSHISAYKDAQEYGLPKSTILDQMRGRGPEEATSGSKPNLIPAEETQLVIWFQEMHVRAYPLTESYTIKSILDEGDRSIRFVGNLPGRTMMMRSRKRHPEIMFETKIRF